MYVGGRNHAQFNDSLKDHQASALLQFKSSKLLWNLWITNNQSKSQPLVYTIYLRPIQESILISYSAGWLTVSGGVEEAFSTLIPMQVSKFLGQKSLKVSSSSSTYKPLALSRYEWTFRYTNTKAKCILYNFPNCKSTATSLPLLRCPVK